MSTERNTPQQKPTHFRANFFSFFHQLLYMCEYNAGIVFFCIHYTWFIKRSIKKINCFCCFFFSFLFNGCVGQTQYWKIKCEIKAVGCILFTGHSNREFDLFSIDIGTSRKREKKKRMQHTISHWMRKFLKLLAFMSRYFISWIHTQFEHKRAHKHRRACVRKCISCIKCGKRG